MSDLRASTSPAARTTAPSPGSARILVRATRIDARLEQFADALVRASGLPVSYVVDERNAPAGPAAHPIVGLTDARCAALGLYCPPDYAWRCGDYALYLAAERHPDDAFFWLIEYDVRFSREDRLPAFFASFAARSEVDLVATHLQPADWTWHWALEARGRDVRPFRCLFPVVRVSRRAVVALRAKRVEQSTRPLRRLLWPNDEAFVATTLGNGGFVCRDFNSFGERLYDPETFSFEMPIDGEALDARAGDFRMMHPVLFGERYASKLRAVADIARPMPRWRGYYRRVVAKLNSRTAW